ncbi:MAG: MgtC/SapB family protein [Acidobacteriaceae bacterium]
MDAIALHFAVRLFAALLLGAAVGLERQWRQRMAGTRTNALVAAGASAFVMAGALLGNDAGSRMASYVVSGVGFLGAGVIFKDGANVRGLNTAATIWCSASIGVLCGFNHLLLAAVVGLAVLFANTALRPIAYRLHPVLPTAEPGEVLYEIALTCRTSDEAHLRSLLLTAIAQESAILQGIHSDDEKNGDRTRLRAVVASTGRRNEVIERIALRLSIESGVSSLSWSLVPAAME